MADTPKPQGWNPKPMPNITPTKDNRKKANLKVADFDDLVYKQGVRVKVYRSSYCPNVKSIDGAEHEMDCKLCNGVGFVDCYPIDTWAFIQNQQLEKGAFPEGLYDGNTVAATFMQLVELQYFTLVELEDFTDIFIERVKKQDGPTDVLKYPGVRVNFLMDETGKKYLESSDFKLDVNGNIEWCAGKGPERGTIYSINYEMKVRFRAVRAMHVNRFAQINTEGVTKVVKMNEQWLLQKEFLVVRKDISGNVIEPNKIRDSDEDY